jgi:hypothetical protein
MEMLYSSLTAPELCGSRIWDLAVERDAEGQAELAKMEDQAKAPEDVPPQLLFVHQVVLSLFFFALAQSFFSINNCCNL